MTNEITLSENTLDSRDIIARIEDLESEETLDEDDQEELKNLKALADELEGYGDWEHGETLIHKDYWVEYCEELVKDIDALPRDLPAYIANNIDWEGVADDLRVDYTEAGDYLMRA